MGRMTKNEAIKIFKELCHSNEYTEDEKARAILIVLDKWNDVCEKLSMCDVLYALQYMVDIVKKIEAIGTIEEFRNLKAQINCKDCKHWGTGAEVEIDTVKCCEYAGYMVGEKGYCCYAERKE